MHYYINIYSISIVDSKANFIYAVVSLTDFILTAESSLLANVSLHHQLKITYIL